VEFTPGCAAGAGGIMNLLAKKIKLHCARSARKALSPARSGGFVTTVTHDALVARTGWEHSPITE